MKNKLIYIKNKPINTIKFKFPKPFSPIILVFLSYLLSFEINAQVEKYEKVILTRYFKPQVTYSVMTSPEFKNNDLKNKFFDYINEEPETSDNFRNFISFRQSSNYKEIPYIAFEKIPENPLIPEKNFTSMLKTYFKFFISPILKRKVKKQKIKIMNSVNLKMGDLAKKIAKERILNIWGYDKNNSFDYENLFQEAKKNSNDLDEFISNNSAVSENAYNDLMVELINRNFIVIYNLRECMNFDEFYNSRNTPEYKRFENTKGIVISIEAYIFKINWTKNDEDYFFKNCWFGKDSLSKRNKSMAAFNDMNINLELVHITGDEASEQYFTMQDYDEMGILERFFKRLFNPVGDIRSTVLKKGNKYEEYKNEINENSLDRVINNIHDNIRLGVDHFKLRSILSNDENCSSKIGTKENLYKNQRFVAYELLRSSNGEIKKSYKGVLSSLKPQDNKRNKSVKTKFKQERGSLLYNGMIIEEQPLNLYGFSFSYLQPLSALRDTTINFTASLGVINLNYTRFNFLKGIYLDPFGIEISKKTNTSANLESFLNVQWRPSISRNIYIPKFPFTNLNVGFYMNTLGIFSFTGITPFIGLNMPIGSNTSIQLNVNYGFVFSPNSSSFSGEYNTTTEEYEIDWEKYDAYKNRINGLSLEAKVIYFPSKTTTQSLKDRKFKL